MSFFAVGLILGFLAGCAAPPPVVTLEPASPVESLLGQCDNCPAPYTLDKPHYCADIAASNSRPSRYEGATHTGRNGDLNEKEMALARTAWKYFENNYQEKTGLVNAVNNYPSTTMWDTASYMGGMVAAYELGIIDKVTMDKRLVTILKTFNNLDLFRGELPNKAYHTKTAKKVNYANKPGEIGYSALDLGRLLIWFKIIKERYPEYGNAIDRAVLRWNFCKVVDDRGMMFGSYVDKQKKTQYVQEGRLGYEEYAAKGFQLWGFSTDLSSRPEPFSVIPIYGVDLPYDTRDPRKLKAHNYVVTESYALDAMEFNWDHANDEDENDLRHSDFVTHEFAQRIYEVQVARYCTEGVLTARTEHQLDRAPYFVYDTIYTDGYPWNTITEKGDYVPEFSAIALKGALSMWAVWDTEYTDLLFNTVAGLYNPDKGFYEGLYENGKGVINTFTANNNGIILEALLYKQQGKLLKFNKLSNSRWDSVLSDSLVGRRQCLPHQRSQG
ncbi:MAG: DUF3131 domain-containing protein [Pseudomonadota bacterium]